MRIWMFLGAASVLLNTILLNTMVTVVSAQVIPGEYIVGLTGTPARQAAVRPRLEALGATVTARLDTVANAFVVRIDDGRAAALAADPEVAHVWPAWRMRLLLDRAAPLVQAPEAWRAVGGMAKAGAGIKVGIIDTGIAQQHPAFQETASPETALPFPPGFPRANQAADLAYTNHKVIVARNYVALATPSDDFGHGTAVAMNAAGVANTGPWGAIAGIAPAAWLGNYKVSEGEAVDSALLLEALDDAVKDGMDVINISSGYDIAPWLDQDPLVSAVEAASALGVVVVVAAGNDGPGINTITSPGTAPSAITVGASENDRFLAFAGVRREAAEAGGRAEWFGEPGNGPAPVGALGGAVVDAASLDGTGEACGTLPAGSLTGAIALILRSPRGTGCTFEAKLEHAQSAGAVAAIVYMNADSPELVLIDVGASTLPAMSVDRASGLAIQRHARGAWFTLQFSSTNAAAVALDPDALAGFSSRGPNVNLGIKPDLVAPGDFLYTATQSVNPDSYLYNASGYVPYASGTSFAAPLVAGAVALLKGARSGLTVDQYRSLVVNSATPRRFGLLLNVDAAVKSTVAVSPVSLSFRTGGGTAALTVANLSPSPERLTVSVTAGNGPAPVLSREALEVGAGRSDMLTLQLPAMAPGPGAYRGYVRLRSLRTNVETVVPYWYGVSDQAPFAISVLSAPAAGTAGSAQQVAFRVTDRAGVPVASTTPVVRSIRGSGTAQAVYSDNAASPGVFFANVVLGSSSGSDVFEIDAGAASAHVLISGN